jgi:hypothetical protein
MAYRKSRKVRGSKTRSRKTARKQRGGRTKKEACHSWTSPHTTLEPPNKQYETKDHQSYNNVLAALKSIPEDAPLILKVGSNDNSIVASASDGKNANGQDLKRGSKPRSDLKLFYEFPTTSGSSGLMVAPSLSEIALMRQFSRYAGGKHYHLLAISPEKEYDEYEWPFSLTGPDAPLHPDRPLSFVQLSDKQYTQSYFPIGINSDPSSINHQILNHLATRPGAVILFNSMGSTCYSSVKYILDMRTNSRLAYMHLGAVDTLNVGTHSVMCSVGNPIYPDPATACA